MDNWSKLEEKAQVAEIQKPGRTCKTSHKVNQNGHKPQQQERTAANALVKSEHGSQIGSAATAGTSAGSDFIASERNVSIFVGGFAKKKK